MHPFETGVCDKTVLSKKGFKKVGTCNKTDMSINHTNCLSKDSIGENEYGLPINCDKNKGISNLIEQCPDSIQDGKPASMHKSTPANYSNVTSCATNGICSSSNNNWQAMPSSTNCVNTIAKNCPPAPTPVSCKLPDIDCCQYPINGECCTVPDNPRTPDCLLTTDLPYDALALGEGASGDYIKYNPNTIDALSKQFRFSLGLDETDAKSFKLIPLTLPGSTSGSQKYLYGQCGSKFKGDNNTFVAQSTKLNKTEYCTQKATCQKATPTWNDGLSPIQTPLCNYNKDLYWYNPNGGVTSFNQSYSKPKTGSPCSPTDLINDTLRDYSGVTGIKPIGDSSDPYSIIKYNVNCDELKVTLPDGSTNWKDLGTPSTWTSTNSVKFTDNKVRIAETCDSNLKLPFCYKADSVNTKCTGEYNGFPHTISKAPRLYSSYPGCSADDTTSGIKYMSHTGKNCKTDYTGKCII